MKNFLFKMYLKSPSSLKRILANLEAIRRDSYRRFADTDLMESKEATIKNMFSTNSSSDIVKINNLLEYARKNVNYYKNIKLNNIKSFKDFEELPIIRKQVIRERKEDLISDSIKNIKKLWNGTSSGSTGTPLKYYKDKRSVKRERDSYDSYYEFCGCDITKNRVRISGAKVAEFNRKKPPYWVYIDRYKQLQCSAYHISEHTYKDYIQAFKKIEANYGTGFPSGWTALADLLLDNNIRFNQFKAIITDSEGLTNENQMKIEQAFNCPVYRTYGLGEVGMCAIECENKHYHVLPTHYMEIVDSKGKKLGDGEEGEIIVSDYNSFDFPFIRYATGDLGIIHHNECGCGFKTPYLSKIVGRVEDYILTKDGRKITRLTEIVKPAIGIRESQIIQNSRTEIIINVIPEVNFDPKSMEKVMAITNELVGEMNVSWQAVKQLERMPSGKLKYLIRKI